MKTTEPLITVITVCYNSEDTIEDTLESVWKQKYKNYEHIIIDGLSKDGTLDIVDRYTRLEGSRIKVISESDKGLYDAMNKGVKLASGDIIGILNSDDFYKQDEVLGLVAEAYTQGKEVVYGDIEIVNQKDVNQVRRLWKAGNGNIRQGWIMPHPTLFVSRSIYDRVGGYNLKYRISADYDFMSRLLKVTEANTLMYVPQTFTKMRDGGVSNSGLKSIVDGYKQINSILKSNGYRFRHYINCMRLIRKLGQFRQS